MKPDRPGMSRLAGRDGLLLTTACLWGVTFVAQKDAVGVLPPLAFVASRFAVSAIALAPLALFKVSSGSTPGSSRRMAARGGDRRQASSGYKVSAAGRARRPGATNGGFLTACYVVLTPFVVWALSGTRPRVLVLAAGFVSLLGAWLLAAGGGPARPPTIGDGLVLAADLAWATGIGPPCGADAAPMIHGA